MPAAIGIVALVVLAALGSSFTGSPLSFRDEIWTHVVSLLGGLAAVSIFLERSIEVFLSAFRASGADCLDSAIETAQKEYDQLRTAAGAGTGLLEAKKNLDDAQQRRTDYRNRSRIYALWGGLFGGTLISLVGLRTLSLILAKETYPTTGWRGCVFVAIDVLLSGALIAGGSDAINKVTKLYSTVMESAGKKVQAAAEPKAPIPAPRPTAADPGAQPAAQPAGIAQAPQPAAQ